MSYHINIHICVYISSPIVQIIHVMQLSSVNDSLFVGIGVLHGSIEKGSLQSTIGTAINTAVEPAFCC